MNNPTTPDLPAPATKPARRAHRTREQWAELIALHSESGLDVARFCEQHDVGVAAKPMGSKADGFAKPMAKPMGSELQ